MPIDQLWIIYALVFGAALLAVHDGYWLFVRTRSEKKAINRRLALGATLDDPTKVLETLRRERGLKSAGDMPLLPGLPELLVQTGMKIDLVRLFLYVAILAALLCYLFSFAFGFGLLALAMAVALATLVVVMFIVRVRSKRIRRFGEQLPDGLDVIVRGLRAGHPFRVAVGLVGREMPDPIGSEFGIFLDEITFGLDVNSAVGNLCRRVGHEDLTFFAVSINIQDQTGGNLAEILARLSQLIRNRAMLRLKVRALTAEGRLSGIFLSLAPFILFGIIHLISPGYFGDIATHPAVGPALAVAGLLLLAGNFIMYRMVNFKV